MDAENFTTRSEYTAAARSRRSSSSMSHRLEEIVAQLMRPIHNLKQNFDIDLSLLEEYLTEMGVRRLSGAPEDFATIAMLVQQCAHIYGKKVDFYEQSVFDMIEKSALTDTWTQNHTNRSPEDSPTVEAEATTSRKRKRRHSGAFMDFAPIDLEPAPNIGKQSEPVRQPPTLPKTYIEFERPPLGERDARLYDYQGCEIGVAADFHVNWNMDNGMIVDHLDSSAAINREMVVPIVVAVLDEMRRLSPPMSGSDSGIEQPDSHFDSPAAEQTKPKGTDKLDKSLKRKTGNGPNTESKKKITARYLKVRAVRALWRKVKECDPSSGFGGLGQLELQELECGNGYHEELLARALRKFCLDSSIEKYSFIVDSNKDDSQDRLGFKGYSNEDKLQDRLGMLGFTGAEVREVCERSNLSPCWRPESCPHATAAPESDDDGFFEMSDVSQADASTLSALKPPESSPDRTTLSGRVEAWHSLVGPRVAEAESRPAFDIHDYSRRILARLPPDRDAQFATVARHAQPHEVCRYFLATLFLANTGNVDIVNAGPPLSVQGFDVRLLTADKSLFASANPFE